MNIVRIFFPLFFPLVLYASFCFFLSRGPKARCSDFLSAELHSHSSLLFFYGRSPFSLPFSLRPRGEIVCALYSFSFREFFFLLLKGRVLTTFHSISAKMQSGSFLDFCFLVGLGDRQLPPLAPGQKSGSPPSFPPPSSPKTNPSPPIPEGKKPRLSGVIEIFFSIPVFLLTRRLEE